MWARPSTPPLMAHGRRSKVLGRVLAKMRFELLARPGRQDLQYVIRSGELQAASDVAQHVREAFVSVRVDQPRDGRLLPIAAHHRDAEQAPMPDRPVLIR
jgi:hypothetical protein